jgi:hypothetical protein
MAGKTWNGKSMSGNDRGRPGGGSIVSTTRNGSMMKQSKGQGADAAGPDIASASTPTGKKGSGSGGAKSSSPSLGKTFAGSDRAGDAGAGIGGSHKLGAIYSNK